MIKIRVSLVFALMAIIIAGTSGLNLTQMDQSKTFHGKALAKTREEAGIYLPLIFGKTPLFTPFGVEMLRIKNSGLINDINRTGTVWVRRNGLLWSDVQPEPNQYYWDTQATLENQLKNAASNGMRVILVVRSTPTWAQKVPGSACGPIASSQFGAFGDFMYQAVLRYSRPPFNVKYWELYNEPDATLGLTDNMFGCWGQSGEPYYGGYYYGQMLNAVYPRIKAADPQAKVINGGLLLDCDPRTVCGIAEAPKFLQGMFAAGAGNSLDGINFHAYDYSQSGLGQYRNQNWASTWNTTGPVLLAKIDFIRSLMQAYGVTGKFLVNSEVALIKYDLSNPCDATCETNKAIYIPEAYAAAAKADIQANIWYSDYGWRYSGLLDPSDGSPLPAYYAYKAAHDLLRDAVYVQNISLNPQVSIYELRRDGVRFWIIWSLDGASHNISLPGTPAGIWDLYGNSQAVTGNAFAAAVMPHYIEWYP
jgi:hypothetical protein